MTEGVITDCVTEGVLVVRVCVTEDVLVVIRVCDRGCHHRLCDRGCVSC